MELGEGSGRAVPAELSLLPRVNGLGGGWEREGEGGSGRWRKLGGFREREKSLKMQGKGGSVVSWPHPPLPCTLVSAPAPTAP